MKFLKYNINHWNRIFMSKWYFLSLNRFNIFIFAYIYRALCTVTRARYLFSSWYVFSILLISRYPARANPTTVISHALFRVIRARIVSTFRERILIHDMPLWAMPRWTECQSERLTRFNDLRLCASRNDKTFLRNQPVLVACRDVISWRDRRR